MKWFNKILGIGTLAFASLTFSPEKTEACSSAKPMGRGGTNVAVADDASAIYWNPAGLIQLERPELDITFSPNNRYRAFLCYGKPLDEKNAIGVNFSYRKDENYFTNNDDYKTILLRLGYSRKLTNNFSIGGNLTFIRNYREDELVNDPKISILMGGDLGFLYRLNDKIKLGLLLQGFGNNIKEESNIRPGASIKINKTLLAFEGYDVFEKFTGSSSHFRCGLERKVNDNWSLRCGIKTRKKLENDILDDSIGGSIGASYRKNDLEMSIAYSGDFILSLNKRF